MIDATTFLAFGAAFAASATIVCLATPIAGRVARRYKFLDIPNHRKTHQQAIPRLGGAAVFAGIISTFLIMALVPAGRDMLAPHIPPLLFLGAGGLLLFLVGLADDYKGISPRIKLQFQVAAALLAYFGGFQFQLFRGDEGGGGMLGMAVSLSLTVFWTLGTTNAINLIDGLDGLASGITGIALVTLGIISILNGHLGTALAAFICAGAATGFLWHNRHPAKIFLGDSGSLLLGFLLAALTIQGTQQGSLIASLVAPLCLLFVPLLDTVLAMVRRALKGLPFTFADNQHLHHRLLRGGMNHPKVVLVLWSVAFVVAGLALALQFIAGANKALVVNAFAIVLLVFTLRHLAGQEVAESLRTVRNINRRKATPRGKVLTLRRALEATARRATADSLLEDLIRIADKLELDSLKISMTPVEFPESALTVLDWERQMPEKPGTRDWNPAPPPLTEESATAGYAAQPGTLVTVEVGHWAWKRRRRSEDLQLWARILVEKLATLEQIRIFCPGTLEPQFALSDLP